MVANLLLDLLLPATDRAVKIQWMVMTVVWLVVLWLTRRLNKDYRLFIYGLLAVNLGWFAVRAVH